MNLFAIFAEKKREMERIFIVGYMGAGKTTVGKGLAKLRELTFLDLDAFIENKYRKTVSQLFAEKGESEFRRMEQSALREVSEFENIVVSTGGGAPCYNDNMELMNKAGTTVYIEAGPEELAARLLASKTVRPLIAGKSRDELIPFITRHLEERKRYYQKAHIVYHTDRLLTKEQVHLTINGMNEILKNRRK